MYFNAMYTKSSNKIKKQRDKRESTSFFDKLISVIWKVLRNNMKFYFRLLFWYKRLDFWGIN